MADQGHQVKDLTPEDVSKGIADGRYLLVDVPEPNEVAAEAYPGAVVVARVRIPEIGTITCVSVYGLINVYAQLGRSSDVKPHSTASASCNDER